MTTRVWESTIIDAPINIVWELVRPVNFSYLPDVLSSSVEGKAALNEVGSVRVINYKDKTVQKLRLTELSDGQHTVQWDLIESVPAHHVLSASYSVMLRPITLGSLTFVEWIADFSKDITNAASVDASFKAKDHFKALAATAKAKLLARGATAQLGKDKVSVPQLTRQLSTKSAQLLKLFGELDKNKNGTLEFDEFALCVNKLYGENLSDEAIRLLLRSADTNNDNVVSYEEFVKFLSSEGLEPQAMTAASAGAEKKQPALALHYFNARGRAEVARLIMAEAGLKYTDSRYDFNDFVSKLKPKMPFGQMPALDIDGKVQIAQSQAINRYLAKLGGLYGRTAEDAAKIDMVAELFASDLGSALGSAHHEKDAKLKEEKFAKFWADTAPTLLGYLEKQLRTSSGGGFFLGGTFSVADIIAFNDLSRLLTLKADVLNAFPLLHSLVTKVGSRSAIAKWVKARPVTVN